MPYRKQATVMFTDVVGFTSIMEQSENEAMRILSQKMQVVRKLVSSYQGRLVKVMGDGTLCVFSSSSDAVAVALAIQESLEEESFKIRIGIHCGSVLFESNDIFGDTVNVASRLESKAPGGGTLISKEVLLNFSKNNKPETIDLGLTRLKGLGRLLQIHFLGKQNLSVEIAKNITPVSSSKPLVLSVFPLVNQGAPDDEFYAYGISADLLSDLAKASSISIVPVTSLLRALKSGGNQEDVAKRFGSSILITGTILTTDSQVKLSLSLKEIASNRLIWKDNWIEDIDDLPLIKGKLADGILKALGKNPEEYPAVSKIEVKSVSTYEKYLRAVHLWRNKKTSDDIQRAVHLIKQVIEKEPLMIPAKILLAETYRDSGEYASGMQVLKEAQQIAIAESNQSGLLSTLRSFGISFWMRGELDEAQTYYNEAMQLAKKLNFTAEESSLLNNLGLIDCDRSHLKESLAKLNKSLLMSNELGSKSGQAHCLCNIGLVHYRSGNGEMALEYYKKSLDIVKVIQDQAGEANLLTNIGIIYNERGEVEKAYKTVTDSMKLSEVLNDKRSVCRALNNMGSIMLTLGIKTKAEIHFFSALSLAEQIGLKNMEDIVLTNIGILRIQTHDWDDAEKQLLKSLSICIEIDDKEGIVENKIYLSEIHRNRKEYPLSIQYLQEALSITKKFHLMRLEIVLKTELAISMMLDNQLEQKAENLFIAAKNSKISDTKIIPDVYWNWSKFCLLMSNSDSISSEQKKKYKKESEKWKIEAKQAILNAAEKIQSSELKSSFLNNIPIHKEIISALVTKSL